MKRFRDTPRLIRQENIDDEQVPKIFGFNEKKKEILRFECDHLSIG